jgi:hypothetical protein
VIFDLTLEGEKVIFSIHPSFFEGGSLEKWKNNRLVKEIYSARGEFHTGPEILGFGERIRLVSKTSEIITYEWQFPERNKRDCMCVGRSEENHCTWCNNVKYFLRPPNEELMKFLTSIYLLLYYEVGGRFAEPKKASGQTFLLNLNCDYNGKAGTAGCLYPIFMEFLNAASDAELKKMSKYMLDEHKRIYEWTHGRPSSFLRSFVEKGRFHIEVPGSATYVGITNSDHVDYYKRQEFSSHNVDSSVDQFCLVMSIIAMNTYFRKVTKQGSK